MGGDVKKNNFIEHNTQLITNQSDGLRGYQNSKAIYAGYMPNNTKNM